MGSSLALKAGCIANNNLLSIHIGGNKRRVLFSQPIRSSAKMKYGCNSDYIICLINFIMNCIRKGFARSSSDVIKLNRGEIRVLFYRSDYVFYIRY